jgi:2-polyprenyl-6-methoxyphenol hydroxylase-like FAD-dependent oxidoreductase
MIAPSTPDIAIVGGGPSGLALAGMLERHGFSYVVYERSAKTTPPAGGCLDLHKGSGQRAMREAGCFDEMRKLGRLGAATVAQVWDYQGNKSFSWGEDRDAPELDRGDIRKALLTSVSEENVRWETPVKKTERKDGNIVLTLEDGSTVGGFKLVVGADGTWSKVRHLVSHTVPWLNTVLMNR